MPKALKLASFAVRVLAWGLCLLTVLDALGNFRFRSALLGVNSLVTSLIPQAISGLFVFQTPFGGAFRGDFALTCAALLVLEWALARAAAVVSRRGHEGRGLVLDR